jgi:phosphatidate phosphatase APP1
MMMNSKSQWCIISDIDDTLVATSSGRFPKVSAILNTFLRHPKSIDGMPDMYRNIQQSLKRARFWYISVSPYKAFPILRSPINLGQYPNGNIVIPSWKQAFQIHLGRIGSGLKFKILCIEKLHKYYASHKLICVGDSLRDDPEIYGEVYRRYPEWVRMIFIRITGKRNSKERFQQAFSGVPVNKYKTFQDPWELYEYFDSIL